METGLSGRTVIVTGGNANIGRGISLAFAAEGSRVVVVGRDPIQGQHVCEEAMARGASAALWHAADVTNRAQVDELVAAVIDEFGSIDVLVNNVGGNVDVGPFVDSDPKTWEQDIGLNLMSTLQCTHAVLPGMIARSAGCIINVGSTAGLVGDAMLAVYSASKGAVHSFTKVLAKEVGHHGVRVNAIAPYGTLPEDPENDLSAGSRFAPDGVFARVGAARPEVFQSMGRSTVLERETAVPSEIGAAAVYLASDGAAFVTAQVLVVDGGTLVA
jgi:2-hydroxycyclohexanecarboxyl-CoA dehydrogenase